LHESKEIIALPASCASLGVDEIYRLHKGVSSVMPLKAEVTDMNGKQDKFLTVVSNLETSEPLWFGKERKKETLNEFKI
jgi:hypothetical protein